MWFELYLDRQLLTFCLYCSFLTIIIIKILKTHSPTPYLDFALSRRPFSLDLRRAQILQSNVCSDADNHLLNKTLSYCMCLCLDQLIRISWSWMVYLIYCILIAVSIWSVDAKCCVCVNEYIITNKSYGHHCKI